MTYQEYQLNWMIKHGYSIDDLISELTKVWFDSDPKDTLQDIYEAWEHDVGFGGQIWVCPEEFEDFEIDDSLAEYAEDCDDYIPYLDGDGGFEKAKELYKNSPKFQKKVVKQYKYYWDKYLDDAGDAKADCIIDALSDEWRTVKGEYDE